MTQLTDAVVDDFYADVGARVRNARARAHVTQATLARQVALTRSSIANLEAGRQRIPLHLIFLIAEVLNADVHDLLPGALTQVEPSQPPVLREYLREAPESTRAFVGGALAHLPAGSQLTGDNNED